MPPVPAGPAANGKTATARPIGNDYTGWWVYVVGPVLGAAIAVMITGAVRGLPSKEEREAAEGGALPQIGGRLPHGR